jgi:hypothetical protein
MVDGNRERTMNSINGSAVIGRRGNTIFIRLPRELWRSCGVCRCDVCKGGEGYWDTLAVAATHEPGRNDYAWTVHYPTATVPDGAPYYTVVIPFSETATEWHPTERTGPFSTLTRGAFQTESMAREWADAKLAGQPYTVRRVE